jgi:hypothetical protein
MGESRTRKKRETIVTISKVKERFEIHSIFFMFNLEFSKGAVPLWSRELEEQIEAIRREMEQVAIHQGITHPQVYQLSLQLDKLHNQWQKQQTKESREPAYCLHRQDLQVNEPKGSACYQTTRGA